LSAIKRIKVKSQSSEGRIYDFLAVTTGVNIAPLNQFVNMDFDYRPAQTTKLVVREYLLGEEVVSRYIGSAFHAFLLDNPGLDYDAINWRYGAGASNCQATDRSAGRFDQL